ncbi:aspartate--tRNA ligase [Oscillospiraceae bacterium MB08-C2-2]|nr:aspartate--tRNA ligase [Oscillospiraceae bacterium MB08-C2-2]
MDTMQGLKRTHYCGRLRESDVGKTVVAAGFVQKIRDKGSLVFIDLRDRSGILQLIFDDGTPEILRKKAASVRSEYVLMAKGVIRERSSKNPELPTGAIELFVEDLRILSKAETPPFEITDETNVKEELRLRYRYLDLRRSEMQNSLILRHKIVKEARDYYDQNDFLEIETPIMIKSTPEGARDYLVPSRVQPGKFFALPQSPQLYKQLLMVAGYDRYMQVARCFRDEDLRADRQPEFTQIDLEMSFVDEEDVMSVNEGFMAQVFKKVLNMDITLPFKRLPYSEAMDRYGSDKPDTRFGLELINLTDLLTSCEFKVFAGVIAAGGSVRAINVKGAADTLTRKEVDKLTEVVRTYGAGGLAFTRMTEEPSSSFEKFLTPEEVQAIHQRTDCQPGDVLLVVADKNTEVVQNSIGALRCHLADKLGLIPENSFDLLWVVDFPLFEYDPEENRYAAKHHPFTSPKLEDLDKLESDPGNVRARAYDMVLNGCEVGGGSIRINNPELQSRMFAALGLSEQVAKERFGFLLEAFQYGVPPHGGMAFGLDRLVMLLLGKSSIRDVMAFPKVQNSSELMTGCPAPVESKNLDELHVALKLPEED